MPKYWFVLYTKPRNELKVAARLSSLGIDVFAPTKTEIRQWSDRKKKIQVPLLPSIVLVRLEEQNVNNVFSIPGVVKYLFENGKRAKVSEEEILSMKVYFENKYSGDEIKNGDVVKVPILNKEAEVLSVRGKDCVARMLNLGALVSFQLS